MKKEVQAASGGGGWDDGLGCCGDGKKTTAKAGGRPGGYSE